MAVLPARRVRSLRACRIGLDFYAFLFIIWPLQSNDEEDCAVGGAIGVLVLRFGGASYRTAPPTLRWSARGRCSDEGIKWVRPDRMFLKTCQWVRLARTWCCTKSVSIYTCGEVSRIPQFGSLECFTRGITKLKCRILVVRRKVTIVALLGQ